MSPANQRQTPSKRITFWPYSILLVVAFIVFVLCLVPVQRVWEQVKTPQMEVQLSGLQGTLWKGSADWAEWRTTAVQAVEWSFHPWALLRGVWEYQVNFSLEGAPITGYLGVSVFGNLNGHDLHTEVRLEALKPLNNNTQIALPAAMQGELQVQIDELVIEQQWPSVLQGTVQLRDLGLVGVAELGDWQGRLYNDASQNLMMQFEPTDDLLLGEGTLMLSQNTQWALALKIKPAPSAETSDIAVLLSLLGAPDDQGFYGITQRGRLR